MNYQFITASEPTDSVTGGDRGETGHRLRHAGSTYVVCSVYIICLMHNNNYDPTSVLSGPGSGPECI